MNSEIKIANAPCSWGVLEFDLEGKSLGYQQVLDEILETGYAGTELGDWGFMPTNPKELKKEIANRKLNLLGAFVPVDLANESSHEEGIHKALDVAELMFNAGYTNAFIVLADDNGSVKERTENAGRISDEQSLSPEQMNTFAKGAEKIAQAVKDKYRMRTVFHHHCAGYIETPSEINALMNATDPKLLGLCFDTGHYRFGGGKNPVDVLEKYWDRIWHLHFKDFSPQVAQKSKNKKWDYFESVKNGVFCELGKGDVDFVAIKNVLNKKNYQGWIVVEQDVLPGMGAPKQCAENNRNYLQSIGL